MKNRAATLLEAARLDQRHADKKIRKVYWGKVMTPLNDRRLLLSVVKLTEKADVRTFELSLIETLHQFISAKTIQVYKIHEDPDNPPQKILMLTSPSDDEAPNGQEHEPILLEGDAAFAECLAIDNKIVVNSDSGAGVRIIHPLKTCGPLQESERQIRTFVRR